MTTTQKRKLASNIAAAVSNEIEDYGEQFMDRVCDVLLAHRKSFGKLDIGDEDELDAMFEASQSDPELTGLIYKAIGEKVGSTVGF